MCHHALAPAYHHPTGVGARAACIGRAASASSKPARDRRLESMMRGVSLVVVTWATSLGCSSSDVSPVVGGPDRSATSTEGGGAAGGSIVSSGGQGGASAGTSSSAGGVSTGDTTGTAGQLASDAAVV